MSKIRKAIGFGVFVLGLLIFLAGSIVLWIFPIIISIYLENFWYVFLYIVWWLPAVFIQMILHTIFEIMEEISEIIEGE